MEEGYGLRAGIEVAVAGQGCSQREVDFLAGKE